MLVPPYLVGIRPHHIPSRDEPLLDVGRRPLQRPLVIRIPLPNLTRKMLDIRPHLDRQPPLALRERPQPPLVARPRHPNGEPPSPNPARDQQAEHHRPRDPPPPRALAHTSESLHVYHGRMTRRAALVTALAVCAC